MSKSGWFVGLVLVAGVGVFTYQLFTTEPQSTRNPMDPPDLSGFEDGAPLVQVKLPESLSDNAQLGKRIFDAKCSVCHGENAAGQNGVAPSFILQIYQPGHHSDMAFVGAAKNGVRGPHHWDFGSMPPVEGITDGEVKLVANYIRELQRANGIN